ncbi:unnamed protein product [Alternaria alternata]
MPLLYGEGNQAFRRLQEEIIRKTDDDSILAWGLEPLSELDGDADSIGVYGWIGLLRCSTTSSPDFLGILLCPETDDNLSRRVARTRIILSGSFYHTFRIVSRTAVKSVLETVTITASGGRMSVASVQRFDRGHRQVLVNVSQAVKDLHFKVESGTAWNIAEEIHGYNQEWDAGPAILTIKGEKRFKDIFQFRFTNDHGVEFSIFMRTISSRTIVQGGHTFSKSERFDFYQDLEQSSSRYNAEKFAIYGLLGQPLFVRVEVHEKRVYDHRLFELNVDAVGTL